MGVDLQRATFGAGSFLGLAQRLRAVRGAQSAVVGYMGGHTEHPTADGVARGTTGHVEVVQVSYYDDGQTPTYPLLLRAFWEMHDSARRSRTDAETGRRFRSVVFTHTPEQAKAAHDLEQSELTGPAPALTTIRPASRFWPASFGQQDFFERRGLDAHFPAQPAARQRNHLPEARFLIEDTTLAPVARGALVDLMAEFGRGFSGRIVATLRMGVLDDPGHVGRIVDTLRHWVADVTPPDQATTIRRVVVTVNPVATETELRCQAADRELTVVVNLVPGNSLPHAGPGPGAVLRSHSARVVEFDDAVDTFWPGAAVGAQGVAVGDRRARRAPATKGASGREGQWYEHVPDLDFVLVRRIGESEHPLHAIGWRRGRLVIDAADVDREHTLEALAGQRCFCGHVAQVWRPEWIWMFDPHGGAQLPLAEFELLGRWDSPPVEQAEPEPYRWEALHAHHLAILSRRELEVPSARPRPDGQLLSRYDFGVDGRTVARTVTSFVDGMPGGLRLRWMLSALVWLEEHRGHLGRDDRDLLAMSVFHYFRSAAYATLWAWCRAEPSVIYGTIDCRFLERGEPARASGAIEGDAAMISVGAPFAWILRVWARGLAVIDGRLVLEVDGSADASELSCTVARWAHDGVGPNEIVTVPAVARWDGDEWHLEESGERGRRR